MKPNRKELVYITWRDAVSESSRAHIDDIKSAKLAVNVNLGWILDEDEERIVLAHGFSTTGEIDHFTIPVGDIVEREYAAFTPRKKAPKEEPSG